MKPGRELDALVAERVMELTVVAHDWPCGYTPDGCDLQASSFVPVMWSGYDSPGPVIAATDYGWPPKPDDETEGGVYAFVEPVSFYSTDIAAAWKVAEKMIELGFRAISVDYVGIWRCFMMRGGFGKPPVFADTAPFAICLAALKALNVEIENGTR